MSDNDLLKWLRDTVEIAPEGIDEFAEGLAEKPERIAAAYRELLGGYAIDPADLLKYRVSGTQGQQYGEVWARDVEFMSFCAHHFLPFTGRISVGYLPSDGLLGLGKLPRLVQCRAQRFQLQERLVVEIVQDLIELGGARWARAESSAKHSCVCYRGPNSTGSDSYTVYEAGTRS